jgi:hypothetical protein
VRSLVCQARWSPSTGCIIATSEIRLVERACVAATVRKMDPEPFGSIDFGV